MTADITRTSSLPHSTINLEYASFRGVSDQTSSFDYLNRQLQLRLRHQPRD
jgi:hypothetical protein